MRKVKLAVFIVGACGAAAVIIPLQIGLACARIGIDALEALIFFGED